MIFPRNCWLTLLVLVLSGELKSQESPIQQYLADLPDSMVVSLKAESLKGQLIAAVNADRRVPSASVIKVPILIELARQADQGLIEWDGSYELAAEDIVGGAGELQNQEIGTQLSTRELAREMIRVSDNTATNVLIRRVGMDKVNRLLEEYQFQQTSLQREMMDFEAIKSGRQNYTSAGDMNRMLRMLMEEVLLSPSSTREVIDLLLGCADRTTIPRLLPTELQVAHKTGTLAYVRGDTGIIFTADNPLLLTIFVEKFDSLEQAEEVIGTLAKIIVAHHAPE